MIFTIKLAFPTLKQQVNLSFSKTPPTQNVSQEKLIICRFGSIFKL